LKADLRSQNLLLALLAVPLLVGAAAVHIVGPVKEFVRNAHDLFSQ
jgi:hypothetical protein